MEDNLLLTLGKIAGIAGISVGFLLIIFRSIIKKKIFPTLTKDQSFKIIKLIIILSFLIGVLGIGGWIFNQNGKESIEENKDSIGLNNREKSDIQKEIKKINREISFRLKIMPLRIEKSKTYEKAVPKANVLSDVFKIPSATYLQSLYPEYNNKSILTLCYELEDMDEISEKDKKINREVIKELKKMSNLSLNSYDVHNMYKMEIEELKNIEKIAQDYYNNLIRSKPNWKE